MRVSRLIAAILLGAALSGCQEQAADLPIAATAAVGPTSTGGDKPPANGDPLTITWNELDVGIQPDTVFEPWMMKTSIKALDGQTVRITGYIYPGLAVKDGIREFVFLRNIDCPYGRQGEAHHIIMVTLADDQRAAYSPKPLTVEGTFHIRPFEGPDGNTWALYAMDGARVLAAGETTDSPPEAIHKQDAEVTP